MWQLSGGIELHKLFKKLILEILAIQVAQEQSKGNVTSNLRIEGTVCRQKTWKFWFIMCRLKFKLPKFFFLFFRKNTRIYTIIHENTRIFKIHEYT